MNSMRLLALVGCVALAAPSFAQTFSNNWSFVDDATGQTVSGIVSGLHNGTGLSAQELTFTVTQSPFADLLGDYTLDQGAVYAADQYSAVDGVVTWLDVFYMNADSTTSLWLGTSGFLQGTNYPYLTNGGANVQSFSVGATFSAVSQADGNVPEPASWALMVAGFGLAGAAMRRRRTRVRFA